MKNNTKFGFNILTPFEILTGECGCIAGYSESCKHVFALLHFAEHHVLLDHNKTCMSKKQTWHETIKKGEKVHPPVRMSTNKYHLIDLVQNMQKATPNQSVRYLTQDESKIEKVVLIGTNLLLPVVEVLLFFASKHSVLITSTQVVFKQTLSLNQ